MKRNLLALALAAAALTSACGDGSGPQGQGRLRFVNISPDAGPMDIVLDGDTIVQDLGYLGTSEYLDASADGHTMQVSATGTATTLLDKDINVADGTDYTVLVADTLASLNTIVLTDDNSPPPAGKVKVRAVQGAPHLEKADVYVTTPDDVLTGSTPALIGVNFGQSSPYLDATAGSYRVRVTRTKTTDVLLIDSGDISLESGQIRTVIAVEAEGGGEPFNMLILPDRD
jgi:Domain of unknown function (DUF4397)